MQSGVVMRFILINNIMCKVTLIRICNIEVFLKYYFNYESTLVFI